MLLIDATYIINGGAKILLEYLLDQINKYQIEYILLVDNRISIKDKNLVTISNSEIDRKYFYKKNIKTFKKIFCFANVPPPIKIQNIDVYIYFHNLLLLNSKGSSFSIKNIILFKLKFLYIKYKNVKQYKWIVQTNYIKKELTKHDSFKKNKIFVIPFYNLSKKVFNKSINKDIATFAYISSGNPHKNHLLLFKAWSQINRKYKFKLYVTIGDEYPNLLNKINDLKKNGCLIENLGNISQEYVFKLLNQVQYIIYPSLYESFGMPLVEAAFFDCKILASDLPYVYEVVSPSIVFNPNNLESIVNAVVDKKNTKSTKLITSNKINNLINLLK